MRNYAAEMSVLVPCIYATGGEEHFIRSFDQSEVRQSLDKLVEHGANETQRTSLEGIFRDAYKPNWVVNDIRTFAAACRPYIQQLNTLRGVGVPLTFRPPFRR